VSDAGYERLSRRVVYENRWLRFEAHEMVHPTGVAGEHGVIVTPPASAIVTFDGNDVLLVRQARFAVDDDVLEVVKGGRHDGEDALACAQRELREEAGVHAARWDALGIAYEIPSIVEHGVSLFLARELTTAAAQPEDVEAFDIVAMPLYDALGACVDGRIDDAVTAIALLRACALIGAEDGPAA